MKRWGIAAALVVLAAGIGVWVMADTPMPAVGQAAPEFSLPGSDGKTHDLHGQHGQPVILAFYPKAFTGG